MVLKLVSEWEHPFHKFRNKNARLNKNQLRTYYKFVKLLPIIHTIPCRLYLKKDVGHLINLSMFLPFRKEHLDCFFLFLFSLLFGNLSIDYFCFFKRRKIMTSQSIWCSWQAINGICKSPIDLHQENHALAKKYYKNTNYK